MRTAAEETAVKSVQNIPPPPTPEEDLRESRSAMGEASRIASWDLSPLELQRLEKSPDEVQKRVAAALDQVSRALIFDSNFGPAWMLKGRLHLGLSEFDQAAESFKRAGSVPAPESSDGPKDDPAKMLQIAADLSRSLGDRTTKAQELLKFVRLPNTEMTVAVISALSEKNTRRSSGSTTKTRAMGPNELALALVVRNPSLKNPKISQDVTGRVAVELETTEEVGDLTPLKDVDLGTLVIHFSKQLDWTTLLQLPMETLDLTGCAVDVLPAVPQRSLLKIRTLNLSNTSVGNIEGLRQMPLLETLSLPGTRVTDLSSLAYSRRLRQLDISTLDPANLRQLVALPLDTLVLSPENITDTAGLQALRLHRTLRVLRSPSDPENQRAFDFWRRFDAGEYKKTSP
jgi:hypothetical protein